MRAAWNGCGNTSRGKAGEALAGFFVRGVLTAPRAELVQLDAIWVVAAVLLGDVVAVLAHLAGQSDLRPNVGTGRHVSCPLSRSRLMLSCSGGGARSPDLTIMSQAGNALPPRSASSALIDVAGTGSGDGAHAESADACIARHKSSHRASRVSSESQIRAANRSIALHPERHRARVAVKDAIRRGRLQRGPCTVGTDCSGRVEAHHHRGYDQPLVVTWLCASHHRRLHAAERRAAA